MENTCEKCVWFGDAILCCFHPENEGVRAFLTQKACEKFRDYELNPLSREEFYKSLNINCEYDNENNCV